MSQENVELVRRIYTAYLSGDFETALAAFDPEVEFDVTFRPDGKVFRGHEGVVEALRTWTGTWEAFRIEPEELIDAGDHVVAVDRQTGRGKGSGLPLVQHFAWVATIRDARLVRAKWFATRAEALEAVGLSE